VVNTNTMVEDHRLSTAQPAFAAIWDHYLVTGFLYPRKLDELTPALPAIRRGWPRLLAASSDVLRMHVTRRGEDILSSACAFRDTDETYVLQHAASRQDPLGMIACLRSLVGALGRDPAVSFLGMYFRPENRSPARWARTVCDAHPSHLTACVTRDYLVHRPAGPLPPAPAGETPAERIEGYDGEVSRLVVETVGPVRAAALGMGRSPLDLSTLDAAYACAGARRRRQVFGVRRDGVLAGVALCFSSSIPMNFSLLCNRVEMFVHPDAPDRANVVRALAHAARSKVELGGGWVRPLLTEPSDTPAVVEAGFAETGKRYSHAVWARETAEGWPSALRALDRLYAVARTRQERLSPKV
jgi:hypothetical protein